MARYTVELRTIVESGVPIFDFPYQFYDKEKKADFERRFIHHFYFREIGAEERNKTRRIWDSGRSSRPVLARHDRGKKCDYNSNLY